MGFYNVHIPNNTPQTTIYKYIHRKINTKRTYPCQTSFKNKLERRHWNYFFQVLILPTLDQTFEQIFFFFFFFLQNISDYLFFSKWMYTMPKTRSRVNIKRPTVLPLSPACRKKAHVWKIRHCHIFYFLCLETKWLHLMCYI